MFEGDKLMLHLGQVPDGPDRREAAPRRGEIGAGLVLAPEVCVLSRPLSAATPSSYSAFTSSSAAMA